jgi:hypothetical protein
MNVAPSTSDPRAARRTSCLGTFLLVLVLWSFSVSALAAYLVTAPRSCGRSGSPGGRCSWPPPPCWPLRWPSSRPPATASRTYCGSTCIPGGYSCTAMGSGRC